ncbi:hypothetical protein BGZ60DRAFT_527666 [Tricladium varicosporioides]|nr:hypothetical protein BGZ60DRAFT_527666 [Hymenoscyphus varicosporioides]
MKPLASLVNTLLFAASVSEGTVIEPRGMAKVNEYRYGDCLDLTGLSGHYPPWHARPDPCYCVAFHVEAVSAYVVAPPGHKAVFYNDKQCGELLDKKEFKVFEKIGEDDPRCVDLGSEEDGTRVRSVIMRRRNPMREDGGI